MSATFDRRSKSLWNSLNLIFGPDLRRTILSHPAIGGIRLDPYSADPVQRPYWVFWPGRTPANYISPRAIAIALADIARQTAPAPANPPTMPTPATNERLDAALRQLQLAGRCRSCSSGWRSGSESRCSERPAAQETVDPGLDAGRRRRHDGRVRSRQHPHLRRSSITTPRSARLSRTGRRTDQREDRPGSRHDAEELRSAANRMEARPLGAAQSVDAPAPAG